MSPTGPLGAGLGKAAFTVARHAAVVGQGPALEQLEARESEGGPGEAGSGPPLRPVRRARAQLGRQGPGDVRPPSIITATS